MQEPNQLNYRVRVDLVACLNKASREGRGWIELAAGGGGAGTEIHRPAWSRPTGRLPLLAETQLGALPGGAGAAARGPGRGRPGPAGGWREEGEAGRASRAVNFSWAAACPAPESVKGAAARASLRSRLCTRDL